MNRTFNELCEDLKKFDETILLELLNITSEQQVRIVQDFHANRARMEINKKEGVRIKKAYDENDDISFDTLEDFNKKNRWKLIITNIIENSKFYDLMNSSKTQNFNIRTL